MKAMAIKEMGLFGEHCTEAFELHLAGGFPDRRKMGSYSH